MGLGIRVALLAFGLGLVAGDAAGDEEDWDGLVPGAGREAVYYACQACHSLAIVKQQGLDRDSWEETLDWMVEEQGMPELEPDERVEILDYLWQLYGPDRRGQDQ